MGLREALPQCVGRRVLLVRGDATREDLLLVGGQPAGPGDPAIEVGQHGDAEDE